MPITGQPYLTARSMTLQIFSAKTSESEPPKTVKSCAEDEDLAPEDRPVARSPPRRRTGAVRASRSSTRDGGRSGRARRTSPGRSSRSARSRASSFPGSRCLATACSGPRAAPRRGARQPLELLAGRRVHARSSAFAMWAEPNGAHRGSVGMRVKECVSRCRSPTTTSARVLPRCARLPLLEVDREDGRVALLEAGRATLELLDAAHATRSTRSRSGGGRRAVRVALEVDDSPSVAEALEAAGAERIGGPIDTPWRHRNAPAPAPDGMRPDPLLGARRRPLDRSTIWPYERRAGRATSTTPLCAPDRRRGRSGRLGRARRRQGAPLRARGPRPSTAFVLALLEPGEDDRARGGRVLRHRRALPSSRAWGLRSWSSTRPGRRPREPTSSGSRRRRTRC